MKLFLPSSEVWGRGIKTGEHEVLTILNVLLVDSHRKVFRGIQFRLRDR